MRRQVALRDAWLARHPGVILDTSFTLRDLGVSGFHGRHRSDKHALGQFLDLVRRGAIAPGSLLIIENLDRLTREDELEATHLFTGLLLAGVSIVQLEPEVLFTRQSGQLDIMRAVFELARGHEESKRKSYRLTASWDQKKKAAAEGRIVTGKCPAWLEVEDGKFRFKAGAKKTVRRIFDECRAGLGCRAIAGRLSAEGVPAFGPSGKWDEAYVRKILRGREAVGEYQPMKGRGGERVPDGPPVPGYYPAAVTEAERYEAQAALLARDNRGGRPRRDEYINPFAALLWDARSRCRPHVIGRVDRGREYRVLMPAEARRRNAACVSFPLNAFEAAVLSHLAEIDPADLLPAPESGYDLVAELTARLAEIDGRLAEIEKELERGEVRLLAERARRLEAERLRTADELAAARRDAASPLAEAWGTCRGLIGALESAPDPADARTRLKAAIARVVAEVWCLFVVRGESRLAAVQVWFAGGEHRDYLICHRPAQDVGKGRSRPSAWSTRSFADGGGPDCLDLRDRTQAAEVAALLAGLELDG